MEQLQIKKIPDGYEKTWSKMSVSERNFLILFEQAQAGDFEALKQLAPTPEIAEDLHVEICEELEAARRGSYVHVEAHQRHKDKVQNIQRRYIGNKYTPQDWMQACGSINPEDAIIAAIDNDLDVLTVVGGIL